MAAINFVSPMAAISKNASMFVSSISSSIVIFVIFVSVKFPSFPTLTSAVVLVVLLLARLFPSALTSARETLVFTEDLIGFRLMATFSFENGAMGTSGRKRSAEGQEPANRNTSLRKGRSEGDLPSSPGVEVSA